MKRVFSNFALPYSIATTMFLLLFYGCTSVEDSAVELSPNFPNYQIDYSGSISDIQSQFDTEMWKTFVALCWPADGLTPISTGNITNKTDARALFENYSFNYDLFLLNVRDTTNFSPVGWGEPDALNQQRQARWTRWHQHSELCPDLVAKAKNKGITNLAEIIPLDEFIQASNESRPHKPLVDLNETIVWSGVVFNKETFDYVVENELYSADGIEKAKQNVTKKVVYHAKSTKDSSGNTVYEKVPVTQYVNELEDKIGAMHLKTSWKVMGDGDDTTKFHTAWAALLFNNLNFVDDTTWQPQCSLVQVGLVGMHISIKTEDQPNSIWATFEHVDNCPEVDLIKKKHYNFYNTDSSQPSNTVPSPNETIMDTSLRDPSWFNPDGDPIKPLGQIVREIPITAATESLNASYQNALANTVWANYQLVSTQWMEPTSQKVYPTFLSNTTLETFDQSGSSCFGCHHQVTANTLLDGPNNEQFTMAPYHIGNVLNISLYYSKSKLPPGTIDTAIYSDYMWSLLKWEESGHLTWRQIAKKH